MANKNTAKAPDAVFTVATPRGLNLREAPGGKVLSILSTGAVVAAVEENAEGKWVKVKAGDREGWVMAEFLSAEAEKSDEGSEAPDIDKDEGSEGDDM